MFNKISCVYTLYKSSSTTNHHLNISLARNEHALWTMFLDKWIYKALKLLLLCHENVFILYDSSRAVVVHFNFLLTNIRTGFGFKILKYFKFEWPIKWNGQCNAFVTPPNRDLYVLIGSLGATLESNSARSL